MTSDTCSIIIRNCICDTLFNMMYSPGQIVPPVFNQVSKFNMAMKSKWKPTSKQVYNHFIFPMSVFFSFSGFSSLGIDREWLIVTGEIFICGVSGNKIFSDREWDGFRNEHPGLWWSDTGSLVPSPQWGRGLPRGVLHIRGGQRLSGTRSLSLG